MVCKAALFSFCLVIGCGVLPAQAGTPSDVDARELIRTHDSQSGQWADANWRQTANALTALIGQMRVTGRRYELAIVIDSMTKNRSWEFGDYKSDSTDDTAWWTLASTDLYDLTGDSRWLELARSDEAYTHGYRDGICVAGVWCDIKRHDKNAISNELYLQLTAALDNWFLGETLYLARAERSGDWLKHSTLINPQNLVNDGLSWDVASCRNNGQAIFTYNQRVILGGLVELAHAHGDRVELNAPRRIASAGANSPDLSLGGLLRQSSETNQNCHIDRPSFKGIFVHLLRRLDLDLPGRPFQAYLPTKAASIDRFERGGDTFGLFWAVPLIKSAPDVSTSRSMLSMRRNRRHVAES